VTALAIAMTIASAVAARAGENVAIQQELIAVRDADEIIGMRDHPFNGDPGSLQIAELSLERFTARWRNCPLCGIIERMFYSWGSKLIY